MRNLSNYELRVGADDKLSSVSKIFRTYDWKFLSCCALDVMGNLTKGDGSGVGDARKESYDWLNAEI